MAVPALFSANTLYAYEVKGWVDVSPTVSGRADP